jgi:hypothetical protein
MSTLLAATLARSREGAYDVALYSTDDAASCPCYERDAYDDAGEGAVQV